MSSRYEEALAQQIALRGLPPPQRQFRPALQWGREYRVDFAWPEHRLLVEVDGGSFVGRGGRGAVVSRTLPVARHQGLEDYRKRNLLAQLGYRMLAFLPEQVQKGEALAEIEIALAHSGDPVKWGVMLGEHTERLETNDRLRRHLRNSKVKARARVR